MVKNVPSPCCGTYDLLIKTRLHKYTENNVEKEELLYTAQCPYCGFKSKEECESKAEAIYEYEQLCIETWKRNRNGMMDWMKEPVEGSEEEIEKEKRRRIEIRERVEKLTIQYK